MKIFSTLVLLLLINLTASELSNFDYTQHGADWYTLKQQWSDCDPNKVEATQQSPIDLNQTAIPNNQSFIFINFLKAKTVVQYLNTTVYGKASPAFGQIDSKTIRGTVPSLKANQIRIRCHSEHSINGKFYDLQLQVFSLAYYSSSKNERLAIGMFFQVQEGVKDPILDLIQQNYAKGQNATLTLDLSTHLNNLQIFNYWYYQGSPTIPPCTNAGMNWVIPRKVWGMSREQRDFFFKLFNNAQMQGNWRSTQTLKDNVVKYEVFSSI